MELKSDRLILRDYQPSDWERVHIYASVPEFSRYEAWGPNSVEESKSFVGDMMAEARQAERYNFNFAVCLKENGQLIGGCGIRRETQKSLIANLGWAINPEFQNHGYATEAAELLIKFGFNQLGLALIYATCDTRNVASAKVMEKLKMVRVGHIKEHKIQKGHLRDSYRYELVRP